MALKHCHWHEFCFLSFYSLTFLNNNNMATKEQPVSTQVDKQSDSVTSNNALQFTDIRRRSMPFVTLDKLLSDIEPLVNEPATTFAVIQRMMNRLDEYSIARMQCEEEDPRWILTALQATDNNITPWIAAQGIQDRLDNIRYKEETKSRIEASEAARLNQRLLNRIGKMRQLLGVYKTMCLYLIEGSAFLRDCVTVQ